MWVAPIAHLPPSQETVLTYPFEFLNPFARPRVKKQF